MIILKHIIIKTQAFILAALFCLLCGCSNNEKVDTSSLSSQTAASKITAGSGEEKTTAKTSQSNKSSETASDKEQTKPKTSEAVSSKPAAKTVTVTIDASKSKNKAFTLSSAKVEIKSGESVFDALKSCCEANNLKLITNGLGNGVYVSSIGGASEFASGSQSGWVYSVNGKIASVGCGNYKLTGGETVKWIYTLDLGRTEAKAQ